MRAGKWTGLWFDAVLASLDSGVIFNDWGARL